MKNKIERLYNEIEKEKEHFLRCVKHFGSGSEHARSACKYLDGLEKAFYIMTGESSTDYFLKKMEEE